MRKCETMKTEKLLVFHKLFFIIFESAVWIFVISFIVYLAAKFQMRFKHVSVHITILLQPETSNV